MKVKSGGGWIDEHGNHHVMPEREIEIPGDDFKEAVQKLSDQCKPPTHLMVGGEMLKLLRKFK